MYPGTTKLVSAAALVTFLATGAGPLTALANTAPPVYPGAVASARPSGVGFKAPPPQAKTYVTPDSFGKVKSWYQAHLKGAQEMQEPGMGKSEDAFLVGSSAASGMIVLVQTYQGKTWIVIGPAM